MLLTRATCAGCSSARGEPGYRDVVAFDQRESRRVELHRYAFREAALSER
jgi:hypothetical protein